MATPLVPGAAALSAAAPGPARLRAVAVLRARTGSGIPSERAPPGWRQTRIRPQLASPPPKTLRRGRETLLSRDPAQAGSLLLPEARGPYRPIVTAFVGEFGIQR